MIAEALAEHVGRLDEVDSRPAAAAEVLAVVANQRPDVIVLDEAMDGAALGMVSAIRDAHAGARVVLLLHAPSVRDVEEALDLDCWGVVDKREPLGSLCEAVRRVGHGQRVFPPTLLIDLLRSEPRRGSGPEESRLSARELQVLRLVAADVPTRLIAEQLFLSVHTVRNHVRRILKKLGVRSRSSAVAEGLRRGLIDGDR